MEIVRMTHPSLPEQTIEVPESAVPHHRASGWRTDDETTAEKQPAETPSPEPTAAEADESKARQSDTTATRKGRSENKE